IAYYGRCLSEGQLSVENQAKYLYNRGLTYFILLQLDRAIADYDAAIKLKPDSTETLTNRGNAYMGRGQYDRAIADYDAAISLKPDAALTFINRGNVYAVRGRPHR